MSASEKKITNAKPIPHIPLLIADVLKVKPPEKPNKRKRKSE